MGRRLQASVDYTNQWGIKTVREAVNIKAGESKIIDSLQFELYQRTNQNSSNGFHIGAEKAMTERLSVGSGFVSIGRNYGDLNNDAFFHGKRFYVEAKVKITRELSISSLLNRAVANDYAVPNRTHFHLACNYDLLGAIARTGLFGGKR